MGAYSDTRESERGTSWQRGSITENLSVSLVRNETEMKSVRTIMRVTDPHNLGYGRDVKELEDYIDLEVVHAWKIEKPLKKAIYETKKVQVRNDMDAMRKGGVSLRPTYTALDNCGLPQLDEGVNERRLLTGTKPELVHAILQNGIDPRFCSGIFGQGAYFAENPSKVDQYCTADFDDGSEFHKILYANNGLTHPGKVFYCFVVKVVVGAAIHTGDGETDLQRGMSVWMNRDDKRILASAAGTSPPIHYHTLVAEIGGVVQSHREFIIFDKDLARLEYLIAFRRV
jgi:hypothetical protein